MREKWRDGGKERERERDCFCVPFFLGLYQKSSDDTTLRFDFASLWRLRKCSSLLSLNLFFNFKEQEKIRIYLGENKKCHIKEGFFFFFLLQKYLNRYRIVQKRFFFSISFLFQTQETC